MMFKSPSWRCHHGQATSIRRLSPNQALKNLERAFGNSSHRRARFPSFKASKHGRVSFRLYGALRGKFDSVFLPDIGWVRLKERGYIPWREGHHTSATVSGRGGRWYVSVSLAVKCDPSPPVVGPVVGVDRGIGGLMVGSDGWVVENPRALERNERKLKRLQGKVSRKQKESRNKEKVVLALERKRQHIERIRLDVIHKSTTMLARTKSVIVLDNLDVKEMAGDHSIAKKVMDAAMAEVAKHLEYKTKWHGSKLYIAAWWYPSTKRCSRCGNVKVSMSLAERVYRCAVCRLTIDRDLNAARNLEQWPRVARTLKTPLERGKPYVEAAPLDEGGTTSPNGGPT